jgi:hypothetical protein
MALGCANSADYVREEQMHDAKERNAAANGQYGAAQDQQRQAEDARHNAVKSEINEGQPVPPATPPPAPYPAQ